jgi:hypothetical protein
MRNILISLVVISWLVVSCAAPAPEGKIVFESERDGQGEIYVMNSDGSDPVNLTHDPGWDGLRTGNVSRSPQIAAEVLRCGPWTQMGAISPN